MTLQTQSAPVRHGRASTRATRNPHLCDKDGPVDNIMHQRLARREQRRAARQGRCDTARRLSSVEALLKITRERMVADSLLLGTDSTHLPEPGEITAETRRSDDAALKALEPLVWNLAERLALDAMTADADGDQR